MQKIPKVWPALAEAANLALLAKFVSPYNLFDLEKKRFLGLSKQDQGLALREQSHQPLNGKSAVNNDVDVDSAA